MGSSIKPPAVQALVIAKSLNGDSKRQIAEDLGIARDTVTKILSSAEIDQYVNEGKSELIRLIPDSVTALKKAIHAGKTTEEAQLVLRSTGVLAPEQNSNFTANVNLGVFPSRG